VTARWYLPPILSDAQGEIKQPPAKPPSSLGRSGQGDQWLQERYATRSLFRHSDGSAPLCVYAIGRCAVPVAQQQCLGVEARRPPLREGCRPSALGWPDLARYHSARGEVSAISAGMASVSDRSAINSSLGIPARPGVPAASFRRAHTQDDQAARSAAWERRCSGQYALSISRFPSTCLVTRRVRDHGRPWRLDRCLWPCSGRRSEALPWQRR